MADIAKPEKPEKPPKRSDDASDPAWDWKTREGRLRWVGVGVATASTIAIIYFAIDWWGGRQQQAAIRSIPPAKVARASWSGKIVALRMDGVGDAELNQLADLSLPNLQALQLEECTFSESAIRRLSGFENLYALDLSGTPLTEVAESAVDTFSKLTELRKLDITRCGLPFPVIQRIQQQSNSLRIIR